ncbi:MAG TPA: amino acid permease [Acetobacteraceae bacterium]
MSADGDEQLLEQLGYQSVLARRVSALGNMAISAAIISPITGVFYSVALVMAAGGPVVMVWGWLAAAVMVLIVGRSMAEINSRYPTSAALYYWSSALAKRHKKHWSWFTGWLNFAGQIGGTAGADYAAAVFIQALIALQWPSYHPTARGTLGIFGVILLVHAVANTLAVRFVAVLNKVAVIWLGVGILVIAGYLAAAPHHTSASFALGHFVNNTGFRWGWYAAAVGLLLPMGTFTGYDASPHLSEETTGAALAAPRGIVRSIKYCLIIGQVLVIAVAFSMTHYDAQASASNPPLQILLDAGGPTGAKICMIVIIGAMLFCGLANLTSNSRQIFAFSRDGAIPGARLWRQVNRRTKTPTNAVWFAAGCAFALGVPSLWNTTALPAILSVNVVGMYSAYGITIWLRLRQGESFEPGPYRLRYPLLNARIAVAWVAFCCVLFVLPTTSPITVANFNYAAVDLAAVLLISSAWWLVSARKRYSPVIYGGAEAMAEAQEVAAI